MPPSCNAPYRLFHVNGIVKRAKGKEQVAFEKDVTLWAMANSALVKHARAALESRHEARLVVDRMFCFPLHEIVCKDGQVKKNDTTNRIKALDDAIATVLGIDDKNFWSGSFDKAVDTDGHRHVMISIYEYGAEHHT